MASVEETLKGALFVLDIILNRFGDYCNLFSALAAILSQLEHGLIMFQKKGACLL